MISFKDAVLEIESKLNLDPKRDGAASVRDALKYLTSDMQKNLAQRTVVVAGTNGKGSTCTTLSVLLRSLGFRVGTFTSPHLSSICERIQIDGVNIPEGEFVSLYQETKSVFGVESRTRFEILTLMAFLYFYNSTDYMIFEVGLGGRRDPVNGIPHLHSLITRIGLDHTEILGNSLEDIAREKFSVASDKPGSTLVCTKLQSEINFTPNVSSNTKFFEVELPKEKFPTGIAGRMGQEAAALALKWIELMNLDSKKAETSLPGVVWPGRLEMVSYKSKKVLLSGDHNPQGMDHLCEAVVNESYFGAKNLYVLMGVSKSKDIKSMLNTLQQIEPSKIILTQNPYKSIQLEQLSKLEDSKVNLVQDPILAFNKCVELCGDRDMIVVTGSLYLVGMIRDHVRKELKNET